MNPAVILAYILLISFVLISLTVSVIRVLFSATGKVMARILRVQLPGDERKRYRFLFTAVWVAVGIYAVKQLENTNPLVLFMTFLTFRNGAGIVMKFIYGVHDAAIIGEHTKDSRALSLAGRAVRLAILTEVLFLLAWAVSYRTITAGIRVLSGLGFSSFLLYLWIAGMLFGAAFGIFIARGNRGILLQDELSTVLLFTGKKGLEASIGRLKSSNK